MRALLRDAGGKAAPIEIAPGTAQRWTVAADRAPYVLLVEGCEPVALQVGGSLQEIAARSAGR